METRLLDAEAVERLARPSAVIPAVEAAFAAKANGTAIMPAKTYIDLPAYDGDFRSMPAYLETSEWGAAGLKWVNVHRRNPSEHGLPTVLGTMIYSDPETAFPLAIMDGTTLTRRRTGAAAAVATDHLATPDASSLGLVGAGVQSHDQLAAIATVRAIEEVVVTDVDEERVASFVDQHADEYRVRAGTIEEAGHCDVCSTVTPVEEPLLGLEDVGPTTHVNAIGADAAGKHELTDEVLLASTLVIDDHEQCTHSGEINVPYQAGTLTDDDIHAELGSVVTGGAHGRTDEIDITVFDSTGLAIQDVAAAHVVYEAAIEADVGTSMDLLGLA